MMRKSSRLNRRKIGKHFIFINSELQSCWLNNSVRASDIFAGVFKVMASVNNGITDLKVFVSKERDPAGAPEFLVKYLTLSKRHTLSSNVRHQSADYGLGILQNNVNVAADPSRLLSLIVVALLLMPCRESADSVVSPTLMSVPITILPKVVSLRRTPPVRWICWPIPQM
jgi:hypothetical protein